MRSVTDPDGRVTRFQYDALNRNILTIDPEGRTVGKTYDADGRVLVERRGDGAPTSATNDVVAFITRSYSDNGQVATFADANPGVTSYTYDAFDWMVRTSFPASGTGSTNASDYEELTLDVAGNVTARRTRSALSITMTYDRLNRMKTKVVPASGSIPTRTATYTYDLAGRQDVVTETGGHNLDWTYDAMGRASSVAISGPQWTGAKTISYQYDASSNRTRLTWPDGYYVAYVYDDLNRLDTATQAVSGVSTLLADYSYDPQSRRTGAALDVAGAGGSITAAFTAGSDLTSIAHGWTGPSGITVTYSYDRGHRLADETFSDSAYRWAPATGVTDTYTPDYLNRYSAARGASLSYDTNQNLTGDGSWTWTYDPENRLVSAAGPSSQTAAYTYDPLGRRVKKAATGPVAITEAYLLDGDEEIAEYDGSGNLVRRFVPSNATDAPIVQVTAAGARTYFRVNRQGTVMAMTSSSGALSEGPFEYDPYGAPASADVSTSGTPFRYTGRRYDPETGLYYYRARYYSAGLGRFMQTDPIGYEGGANLYAYVGSSPAIGTDPKGLSCVNMTGSRLCDHRPYSSNEQDTAPVPNSGDSEGEKSDGGTSSASTSPSRGSPQVSEARGHRGGQGQGERGEEGKNPNPNKHGPRKAFGRPGWVVDTDRSGRKGPPRPARPGEPGYGDDKKEEPTDQQRAAGAVMIGGGIAIGVCIVVEPCGAAVAAAGAAVAAFGALAALATQ